MSIAIRAFLALGITIVLNHVAHAAPSEQECRDLYFVLDGAPFQIKKSTVEVRGRKVVALDLTDQDYDYIANTLNECRVFRKDIPTDTVRAVKQFRRYFDHENARKQQRQEARRLEQARRELDGYMRKILNEAELARVKEIGETFPVLKNNAELTIERNKEKIARAAALEEQAQEVAAQKQKEEQAAFVASLPQSCLDADKARNNNKDVTDKAARANMLAQAGETQQACGIIGDIDGSMEQTRTKIIDCYKDLSARVSQDKRYENAASAVLFQAGQIHQGQLQFRQAAQQLGCK